MNNSSAEHHINNCKSELDNIEKIIVSLSSPLDSCVPFLTLYALIKVHGTIEASFKCIVSDFCMKGLSNPQVVHFIEEHFGRHYQSLKYANICSTLKIFDVKWEETLKVEFDAISEKYEIIDALKSLSDARNSFAHGGLTTITFGQICKHFENAQKTIEIIDRIIN